MTWCKNTGYLRPDWCVNQQCRHLLYRSANRHGYYRLEPNSCDKPHIRLFPHADRSSPPWFIPNPDISSIFLLYGKCRSFLRSCGILHAKAGSIPLHALWGKELAPSNIQVNAIACGVIDTDMNRCFSEEERSALIEEIPAGRMGSPEEVASLAYSLATASSYLNGHRFSP